MRLIKIKDKYLPIKVIKNCGIVEKCYEKNHKLIYFLFILSHILNKTEQYQ